MISVMNRNERPLAAVATNDIHESRAAAARRAWRILGAMAALATAAVVVIALRVPLYGLGHQDMPLFRALSRLWS